jgi:hypothetical protein
MEHDCESEIGENEKIRIRNLLFLAQSLICLNCSLIQVLKTFLESFNLQSIQSSRPELSSLSRKRKQSLNVGRKFEIILCYLLNVRSFLVRKKEITGDWYIKPRTIQWFFLYIDWVPFQDSVRFKYFFRVTPETFVCICEIVHDEIITKPPFCFWGIPNRKLSVPRMVAIALRRLATGDNILGVAELFGLSAPTVSRITWRFVRSFCKSGRFLISWPNEDGLRRVKEGFFQRWKFPNCCGAVDGTHFQLQLPLGENTRDYFDFRQNISVSFQGIVDCG